MAGGEQILGPARRPPLPILGSATGGKQAEILGPTMGQSVVIGPVSVAKGRIVPIAARAICTGPRLAPRASTAEALVSTYAQVMEKGASKIVTTVSSDEGGDSDGMLTPPRY